MAEVDDALAAEVAAATSRYRLQLDGRRFRGRSGNRRGSASGSSLEFLDFRDYVPGDDLRHVDWQGFARSDQLRVRLQEEEVSPFVDVLVDTSVSLAATPAKERATRALLLALVRWVRQEGAVARVLELGAGALDLESLRCEQLRFEQQVRELRAPTLPLRIAAVRVLVTDGLWEVDPKPVLLRLAAGAARFLCLQVLDPWELDPTPVGAVTLHDCETGQRAELRLDGRQIEQYRQRLQRLCDGLRGTVMQGGGVYARVVADSLARMCARDLLPAGVVVPA